MEAPQGLILSPSVLVLILGGIPEARSAGGRDPAAERNHLSSQVSAYRGERGLESCVGLTGSPDQHRTAKLFWILRLTTLCFQTYPAASAQKWFRTMNVRAPMIRLQVHCYVSVERVFAWGLLHVAWCYWFTTGVTFLHVLNSPTHFAPCSNPSAFPTPITHDLPGGLAQEPLADSTIKVTEHHTFPATLRDTEVSFDVLLLITSAFS